MSKPSEKAMQLAKHHLGDYQDRFIVGYASAIDAHTAEALAEHQRVIEMAEKALTGLIKHIGALRVSKTER